MRWFKRFIARLLNIQPEDLPQTAAIPEQDLKAEIARQVRQEVQQAIRDTVLPYIQELTGKTGAQPVNQEQTETQPEPITFLDSEIDRSADEEFPVLDEEEVIALGEPTEDKGLPTNELVSPFLVEEVQPLELEQEVKPELEEGARPLTPVDRGEIRIGIDFGTTTTAVSLKIGDELPVALPIGVDGVTRYLPSLVHIKPGEGDLAARVTVGEDVENFADQANSIRSIKRCLGCDGMNCLGVKVDNDNQHGRQFPWCNGDGSIITAGGETFQPHEIAAFIVKEALSRAIAIVRERLKFDLTIENVTFLPLNLGCGANFNFNQRQLLIDVAHQLGFENVNIENVVEEPILAGFAFSRFADEPEGNSLIYDFGGGTFDVAVINVDKTDQGPRVTILTTAGEQWLGGDDIDTLVYDYFLQQLSEEQGEDPDTFEHGLSPADRSRLRVMAKSAKEYLSTEKSFTNTLVSEQSELLALEITRDVFEQLLAESQLFEKSLDAARRACQLAYAFKNAQESDLIKAEEISKFSAQDMANFIDRLILVGGVTKIPYIQKS